jgi:hypothetical protein
MSNKKISDFKGLKIELDVIDGKVSLDFNRIITSDGGVLASKVQLIPDAELICSGYLLEKILRFCISDSTAISPNGIELYNTQPLRNVRFWRVKDFTPFPWRVTSVCLDEDDEDVETFFEIVVDILPCLKAGDSNSKNHAKND